MHPTHSVPFDVWPCRKGAVDKSRARYEAVSKKNLWRWYNKLKRWKRIKDLPGAGRVCLLVYQALMDVINESSGRLDPGYLKIAAGAHCSRSSVGTVLKVLRQLGVLTWDQCCTRGPGKNGKFTIKQDTNAYRFLPPDQWKGYVDTTPPPPPLPYPDTCGAPAAVATAAQLFIEAGETGGTWPQRINMLAIDPLDHLACGLARIAPPP